MKGLILLFILLLCSPAWATDYTQDANCIGAWLMNVDEDPITDSSGEGRTGALAAADNPDFVASAKFDGGYHFDGSDYIRMAHAPWDTDASWSLVGYHYSDSVTADRGLAGSQSTFQIWMDNATPDRFGIASYDGGWDVRYGTTAPLAETWYHLAMTYNLTGTIVKLYVNGVQEGADLVSGMDSQDFLLNVGCTDSPSDKNHIGMIDELAQFDKTLNSTEINDIMDNGLAPAAAARSRIIIFD